MQPPYDLDPPRDRRRITLRTPAPRGAGIIVSVHGEFDPAETLKELFERHRRRVAECAVLRPGGLPSRSHAS